MSTYSDLSKTVTLVQVREATIIGEKLHTASSSLIALMFLQLTQKEQDIIIDFSTLVSRK